MGLYFNFSIVPLYILIAIIYFVKNKLIKRKVKKLNLLNPRRYFRYFKLFFNSKVLITIYITSIISNTITIFQNSKYENLYKDEENLSGTAIVISEKEEKEYNYIYKIKILDIGKENCKNTYLYLKVSKKKDVFLEYGQPVKSLAVLFRPFHWGYLFLPPSMGLAFYWCGRYIMLFMVSFEMGMLLVKQRKRLALIYAFFIVWSPLVQWWFAINGLVEMLIYVQLSIILLRLYLSTVIFWKRVMCVVGVAICAGGFVLALYPAWMIPLGYILLGLIIWSFWEWNKKNKITRLDAVALFIVGICFLGLMAYIFSRSWETIVTIMNTSYPGERFETGGGYGEHLFNYVSNIWYALKGEGAGAANVCEAAQFIDFFPLCYILPSVVLLRDKIKDKLMIILLIVSLFLEIYAAIGYPALVAKYTFLSMCTPYRVYQITGFGNVILLVRSLALLEKPFSRGMAFLGGSLISYVSVGLARQLDPE